MDSGNSGSLQSSSGGEDEFESRGGGVDSSSLSALLRPTPSRSAAGAFSYPGSLYGLQEFASATPPQQQAVPWSAQFMAGAASASSSSPRVAPPSDTGMRQQVDPSATAQGAAMAAPAPPRGSRKRARASRRAPTTVLTTDTSNFRAMVQEFTGIPSPPFGAGAVGPAGSFHSRFDHLFPSPSALRSAAGAAADPASSMPPYLLRSFAQKLQTQTTPPAFPPFTSPSSSTPPSSNIGVPNANATTTATGTATTAASANQRAAAGDDFQLTSSALLRMQDHDSYLSFQNILGSTQPMFGGFSHAAPRLHEQSPSEFLSGIGGGSIGLTHGGLMVSEGMHMHPRNDTHLGGDELSGVVTAGASGSGRGSCKFKYTSHAGASSSSAAASTDRPPNGAAGAPSRSRSGRGEGLDPWICTSE